MTTSTTAEAETTALYVVEGRDDDGGTYAAMKWRTTEADALVYYRRNLASYGTDARLTCNGKVVATLRITGEGFVEVVR